MALSRLENTLLLSRRGPFLSPDGERSGGGGEIGNADANNDANSGGEQGGGGGEKKVEFSAEQQKHVDKLIGDARKDAARVAADKAKADREAADETARKERETNDLKAKGEFEKVETTLKADLQAARDEATALKGRKDQLEAAIDAVLKADWDALDDDVKEYYPGDEDALVKVAWLPKGKTLQAKLHPTKADPKVGMARDPKSGNSTGPELTSLISKQSFLG